MKGIAHGKGKMDFRMRSNRVIIEEGRFEGEWEKGFRHNTGRVVWQDQSEFHGQFE